jgi:hypothetical protein
MDIAGLIDRAVRVYRTGFVTLLGIAAIVQVPLALIGAIVGQRLTEALGPFADFNTSQPTQEELSALVADALPRVISAALVIGVVAFVAGLFLSPALIATVARISAGEKPSIGDAYRTAFERLAAIFVGSIVVGVALVALFAVVTLVGVVLASQLGGWIAVLAVVAGAVVTIYVGLRWAVWSQVVVVEDRGPLDALSRSWSLMEGSLWRTLALVVITAIATAIAGVVFGVIGAVIGGAFPLGWRSLIPDLLAILTVSWSPIVLTLLFFDLRARRDPQRAAPAPPPGAAFPG